MRVRRQQVPQPVPGAGAPVVVFVIVIVIARSRVRAFARSGVCGRVVVTMWAMVRLSTRHGRMFPRFESTCNARTRERANVRNAGTRERANVT